MRLTCATYWGMFDNVTVLATTWVVVCTRIHAMRIYASMLNGALVARGTTDFCY